MALSVIASRCLRLLTACQLPRRASAMAAGQRLQQHLEAVDLAAPPRVELTYGSSQQQLSSVAVLDSSFNPPTRAHLQMLSATASKLGCSRSLLLLAKNNADKPVVGASLVQRLEMMQLIAEAAEPPMLCGVTAHPLFVDKAAALQALCGRGAGDARIVVLVGFDTWVRIVDPKYYPGEDGLEAALRTVFRDVEVVVASRDPKSASNLATDGAPLSAAEQEAAVRALPEQLTLGRLHFLHTEPEVAAVSSSEVRRATARGELSASLPESVAAYVAETRLYMEV